MLKVYLLRHGQTDYNAQGNKYCGRTDIPLNAKGLAQAVAVRKQLEGIPFDGVYSSPLQRAVHTARIASGQDPITDERLIELDFGQWEGKTREEFVKEDPDAWDLWEKAPEQNKAGRTGESGEEVVWRMESFFKSLTNGTYMVVAHNGVNRLFLARQLGMPLKNYRKLVQENSRITLITYDPQEGWTLEMLNANIK